MTVNRKEMKQKARQAMKNTKPSAVWVTLVLTVILAVMQLLSLSMNGYLEAYQTMYEGLLAGEPVYVEPEGTTSVFGWLLTVAMDLMSMVLEVGFVLYCVRVGRSVKASFGDVFDAFGVFFRAVWISVLPAMLVALWSLVYVLAATFLSVAVDAMWPVLACLPLLIPMVMASYSYRLSTYLMLDNPQRTCMQCVAMSRTVMKGRRWELFKLDLSFIGWGLLCAVPFVSLWVQPYMGVTRAAWYDAVMSDYLRQTANGPFQPPEDVPPTGPEA